MSWSELRRSCNGATASEERSDGITILTAEATADTPAESTPWKIDTLCTSGKIWNVTVRLETRLRREKARDKVARVMIELEAITTAEVGAV